MAREVRCHQADRRTDRQTDTTTTVTPAAHARRGLMSHSCMLLYEPFLHAIMNHSCMSEAPSFLTSRILVPEEVRQRHVIVL